MKWVDRVQRTNYYSSNEHLGAHTFVVSRETQVIFFSL